MEGSPQPIATNPLTRYKNILASIFMHIPLVSFSSMANLNVSTQTTDMSISQLKHFLILSRGGGLTPDQDQLLRHEALEDSLLLDLVQPLPRPPSPNPSHPINQDLPEPAPLGCVCHHPGQSQVAG